MIVARKNAQISHNNCPKKYFPDFFFGGGARAPLPPSPTPMHLLMTDNVCKQVFILGLSLEQSSLDCISDLRRRFHARVT